MCDYGRLNFEYLQAENRLLEPRFFRRKTRYLLTGHRNCAGGAQLKGFSGSEIAIIASGRMTNEELWLTSQLAKSLGTDWIDIVPRRGPGDNILLSEDRNPNTNGARLILGSQSIRARTCLKSPSRQNRKNQGAGDSGRKRDAFRAYPLNNSRSSLCLS